MLIVPSDCFLLFEYSQNSPIKQVFLQHSIVFDNKKIIIYLK